MHFDAYTTGQPSVDSTYHSQVEAAPDMTLAEVSKAGGRISRIRLLGEAGYRDISYIHATLPDGRLVRVNTNHCPQVFLIPANRVKGTFIEWAKAEGVYAKGLGLLDDSNYSVLV